MVFFKRKYVVVVEDNNDHQMLLTRAINKSLLKPDVYMMNDGEEFLNYLERGDSRIPDLIILDLKIPKVDGLTLLEALKRGRLKTVPVLIMTTSTLRSDVLKAYDLGASSFISKSENYMRFNSLVVDTLNYWLNMNKNGESAGLH